MGRRQHRQVLRRGPRDARQRHRLAREGVERRLRARHPQLVRGWPPALRDPPLLRRPDGGRALARGRDGLRHRDPIQGRGHRPPAPLPRGRGAPRPRLGGCRRALPRGRGLRRRRAADPAHVRGGPVRVLIFGDWSHTGFGVVTEELGKGLLALGADVRIIAGNHRGEPVRGPLAGCVWPRDVLRQYVSHMEATAITGALWSRLDPSDEWMPDAILVIADVSGILNLIEQGAEPIWQKAPVFHYCPIEGDNLPPIWRQLWEIIAQPVA